MSAATLDEQVRMIADLITDDPDTGKVITTVVGVAILHNIHPELDRLKCLRLLLHDLARRVREARAAEQALREDGWW